MHKESHQRYLHQSNWTHELRTYIFSQIGRDENSRILEVGCGTGAILSQINFPVYGLDLNLNALKEASVHLQAPIQTLACGDAFSLPYANSSFDILFSHFLLLWLPNPKKAIEEMMRITISNGHIVFFAEPDYSQRVDKPIELAELGQWQADALRARGANPDIGGKLAELCHEAGIKIIETGTLEKSTREASAEERANEWETLKADLAGILPDTDIQKMKKIDAKAWAHGERILDVPTYYLWGRNQV
ncbi:MAG: class I SAM-dependent methyltransferase [Anaerolineae bacterium]|jgi:ubiquinone/menaquinone biosynthesis C-methylase UbiE|nr:class I SAM-dependent methyltransferase [Anaerolineae bacterium]MBT7075039.1 class I SAM-dependent methyltransferase [Anaerolineae bacterium]MBT7782848.1 class I SAM-dependent methyltransferase [Anaerolineae bacterium]